MLNILKNKYLESFVKAIKVSQNKYLIEEYNRLLPTPLKAISILIAVLGILSLIFEVQDYSYEVYLSRLFITIIGFLVLVAAQSEFGKKHPAILSHFLFLIVILSSCFLIYKIPATFAVNLTIVTLLIFMVGLSMGWNFINQIILVIYFYILFILVLFYTPNLLGTTNIILLLSFAVILGIMSSIVSYVIYKSRLTSFENIYNQSTMGASTKAGGDKFKDMIENASDGFFQTSIDGKFLEFNPALIKILGYSKEKELLKLNIIKNVFVNEDDREKLIDLLKKTEKVKNYRLQLKKKDGSIITVRLNDRVVYDKDNKPLYMEGSIQDITQQIINEEEKKNELDELKVEKRKATHASHSAIYTSNIKTQFLANMSHEIRTPMNSVLGFLTLIENGLFDSEQELKDFARNAKLSADSLLDIINNILDISKIESGKMELFEDKFNIQNEIEKSNSIITPAAKEKDLDLSYDIDENIPQILVGDATRYRQVLVNLLSNAAKNTEEGSIDVKLELLDISETEVKFQTAVTDTGIGIPEEKIPFLFKPYTQIKGEHWVKHKGTGLGLMICKEFVNLMGGTIELESELDKGTRVNFIVVMKTEQSLETITDEADQIIPESSEDIINGEEYIEEKSEEAETDLGEESGLIIDKYDEEEESGDEPDESIISTENESAIEDEVEIEEKEEEVETPKLKIVDREFKSASKIKQPVEEETESFDEGILTEEEIESFKKEIAEEGKIEEENLEFQIQEETAVEEEDIEREIQEEAVVEEETMEIETQEELTVEAEDIEIESQEEENQLELKEEVDEEVNEEIALEEKELEEKLEKIDVELKKKITKSPGFLKPQKEGKKILLVEDNAISQNLEMRLLQDAGYSVSPVSNGLEAIEAVRTGSFDLVLMDIQMKEMDGIEATNNIRELEAPRNKVPIIAVTAHSSMKDRERCLNAGMDDYIAKPININFLKMTIDQWLNVER